MSNDGDIVVRMHVEEASHVASFVEVGAQTQGVFEDAGVRVASCGGEQQRAKRAGETRNENENEGV